jgi:hypothetical protein
MPTTNPKASSNNYDPRWFIWTIVFLVVSGISLVAYISLSDTTNAYNPTVLVPHTHSTTLKSAHK